MKEKKDKPAAVPIPFTLEEYSVIPPCVCPACGGRMSPVEYYVATKGEVYSKQDWSTPGKVTTTTTKKYRNIRKRIGAICPDCYTKSRKKDLTIYFVLAGVVGAIAIGCIVLFVLFLTSPTFKETVPGGGAVGLIGGLIALYYLAKHLTNAFHLRSHLQQVSQSSATAWKEYHRSAAFVGSANIPHEQNEVLLDLETVRNMM